MKLLKSIFGVAMSNIANFGTSFIIGFVLPAILSVAAYGSYRQYVLYISFTYLFNLGFNDGIYIKYGGKERGELDQKTISAEHNFIHVFQMMMFIVMTAYGMWQQDWILIFFSFTTLFNSLITYHQNLLQATGQFSTYSRGNILKSAFNIILLLIAVFLIQSKSYVLYIIINVISFAFLYVFYELNYFRQFGFHLTWQPADKFHLFKVGFFVLIANMSLTFVGNTGNWVINWWFPIEQFAQYSFQNSVLNVILLVVNAVGMVFYNVISRNSDQSIMQYIKTMCIVLGIGSGIFYFVFDMIIQQFLPNYIPAISLLAITFISIPYIMLSRILFANLYKAHRPETKYFRDSLIYAGLSFGLVVAAYFLTQSMQAIAMATTFCYIGWFVYCSQLEFKFLQNSYKEIGLLVSHFIIFYISANGLSSVAGAAMYCAYLVAAGFWLRNDFRQMKQFLFRDKS